MTVTADFDRPPPGWIPLAVLLVMPILFAIFVGMALRALPLSASLFATLVVAAQDGGGILCYSALARICAWPSLRDRFTRPPRQAMIAAIAVAIGIKGVEALVAASVADLAEPAADPLLATRPEDLLALPVAILLVPFWEEALFRGVLFDRLRHHFPVGGTILASSLVFALVHNNQLSLGLTGILLFASRFAVGAAAALFTWRYRSLTPAFMLHAANNGITELLSLLIPT